MAERVKWTLPLNAKVKSEIWSFVVRQECFRFFRLASPRPRIRTFDRADFLTEESVVKCGNLVVLYNLV